MTTAAASPFPSSSSSSRGRGSHGPAAAAPHQPPGTFLPATKVQVGSHRVIIEKYLSEGGFAHVYVVRVPRKTSSNDAERKGAAADGYDLAVLKRVAVPDRSHLASMRTEVETMKKLRGHRHVVTYMDSHASQLRAGGYEVFLLMEYCRGGGLIDFMNTRLQHRLTEPEILKIFGDVAEGVACLHYLRPPLCHRDLKVENVLIAKREGAPPIYKLCDFGSAAPPCPAATTADEARLIEEDVQKHTTMQYRSPEMIDVWRRRPIDEKSDIWALGVLLYKLCYYTTPFEDVGRMAILNASFNFPAYPAFSLDIKALISAMLKEDPRHRPNIYQVVKQVCTLRGISEVPIKDIYATRTHSETRRNEHLPSHSPPPPSTTIGLQKTTTTQLPVPSIPDIAPMRRGRPSAPSSSSSSERKPTHSPVNGDPFAALDSKNYDARAGAVDELSKRFPSLDEFSIAHDNLTQNNRGGTYTFPSATTAVSGTSSPRLPATTTTTTTTTADAKTAAALSERVTNALADEAFRQTPTPKAAALPKSQSTSQLAPSSRELHHTSTASSPPSEPTAPLPSRPAATERKVTYTSTGTGTSPPISTKHQTAVREKAALLPLPPVNNVPIWRVPTDIPSSHMRSSSQPRAAASPDSLRPVLGRTGGEMGRSRSQRAGKGSSGVDVGEWSSRERDDEQEARKSGGPSHAKPDAGRPRPSSVYLSSNLDFLRDQEASRKATPPGEHLPRRGGGEEGSRHRHIGSDVEFLRSGEEEKRASLGGGGGTGAAKGILGAGRFGETLKRFESGGSGGHPSLSHSRKEEEDARRSFSPSPSPPPPPPPADDESILDETQDLPPDVRRELERRRLSQEERRIAAAAAEYKARGSAGGGRASAIQRRVQSLLDEGRKSSLAVTKTAEGYGRWTEREREVGVNTVGAAGPRRGREETESADSVPRVREGLSKQAAVVPAHSISALPIQHTPPSAAATAALQTRPPVSRPSVPPKSLALRTGGSTTTTMTTTTTKSAWPPPSDPARKPPVSGSSGGGGAGLAALLAKDLEGVPEYPPSSLSSMKDRGPIERAERLGNVNGFVEVEGEEDFGRRFPRLSGEGGEGMRVKDV